MSRRWHRLVRKSFEIVGSIEAILKKSLGGPDVHQCARPLRIGSFRMDVQRRVFTQGGHVIPLAPKTFDLLVLLVPSNGHAVSNRR